mmetsp:Transcript_21321/g.66882  ORF Transcript_21321/g.66882 Transcript_21321/m.66882 type:complete len:410 (-) Transcript_21321:236-1465(-)
MSDPGTPYQPALPTNLPRNAKHRNPALRSFAEEDVRLKTIAQDLLKVAFFYAVGALFYHFFESPRWSLLKSLYFTSVSIFTIGFGDVVPRSNGGRVFSMFYFLVGIAVIFPTMARFGGYLLKAAEHSFLNKLLRSDSARGPVADVATPTSDRTATSGGGESVLVGPMLQMRRHRVRLLFSFVLLLVPLAAGSVGLWLLNHSGPSVAMNNREPGEPVQWTVLDAVWYSYCTLTTIGYGELQYRNDENNRIFLLVFMPCSVILGAAAISNVASIWKEIREENKVVHMLDNMDYNMLCEMDRNGDGVDRNEFVLAMIKALNLVDHAKLERLEKQFDDADVDGSGKLDAEDLEALAMAKERVSGRKLGFYEARRISRSLQRSMRRPSESFALGELRGGTPRDEPGEVTTEAEC